MIVLNEPVIDAHIHLDLYREQEQMSILQQLERDNIASLITVSTHLSSAQENFRLSQLDERVFPAYGFHPEQELPNVAELIALQHFMEKNCGTMIAVGEVGLPYYLRQENNGLILEPYIEILRFFIQEAVILNKPIVLHAVYDDAPIVCDLLEKYSVKKAHFHWFKGDTKTVERMIRNGYYISITPDVLYETEIQHLVRDYPLINIMVETDGPWPFAGMFKDHMTHPNMMHHTIRKIAQLKHIPVKLVYETVYDNTCRFYQIPTL